MRIRAKTKKQPCTIEVTIACSQPRKMYLKVKDTERPFTVFTNRYCTIEEYQLFSFYSYLFHSVKS